MIRYWAVESSRWNHTAKQLHMLNMLLSLVASFGGGTIKMLNEGAFHPYLNDDTAQQSKGQITKENFHVLKLIGDNYVKSHG